MTLSIRQMQHCIEKKRDGGALAEHEWHGIVEAAVEGSVDPGQLGALLMACVARGMEDDETFALTEAMVESGEVIEFSSFDDAVDKHSSGGVGDTASLIVVPVLAASGVRVAKLSGRALGHTGGTVDKLESIPGFRADLDPAAFERVIRDVGCAIATQSATIVPADKVLYAFRDRTATIPCIGLITASIVSKKIAGGASDLAFDVKTGSGAFMKTLDEARLLAQSLVRVAERFGRRCVAIVTDMNEPLSPSIGNAIEVVVAREFLSGGRRAPRLLEVVETLAVSLLRMRTGETDARNAVREVLDNGEALRAFERMIAAQGGDVAAFRAMQPSAQRHTVTGSRGGYVESIDTTALGRIAREQIDHSGSDAGLELLVHIGDRVEAADPLAVLYGGAQRALEVASAFTIGEGRPRLRPVVYETITGVKA